MSSLPYPTPIYFEALLHLSRQLRAFASSSEGN